MLLATFCCVSPASAAFGAVHRHVQHRLIGGLLNTQVAQAGNLAELAQQLIGHLQAGMYVVALYLHVDGSGQAEIQDLRDLGKNIGRGSLDYNWAQNQDEQSDYDESVRSIESYSNDPHKISAPMDELRDELVSEIL